MAITSYSELQTAIVNFTHRSDLSAMLPDFIRLAEDVIYGDLDSRNQDTQTTLTCTANVETVTAPTDLINFKSITVSSNNPHGTVDYRAPDQYRQEFQFGNTGVPRVYTLIGNQVYLSPIPDQAYTLSAFYEAKLTNLSSSNQSNWLLAQYPSVYLYAALVQAAIYMQDENMEAKWQEAYSTIINGININDWSSYQTMQVKTDVNLTQARW